jgi:hypothetical protein
MNPRYIWLLFSLRFILVPVLHIRLHPRSDLSHLCHTTEILYLFLLWLIRATCPVSIIIPDMITLGLNNIKQEIKIKRFSVISVISVYTPSQVYIIHGLLIFTAFPAVYYLKFQCLYTIIGTIFHMRAVCNHFPLASLPWATSMLTGRDVCLPIEREHFKHTLFLKFKYSELKAWSLTHFKLPRNSGK